MNISVINDRGIGNFIKLLGLMWISYSSNKDGNKNENI